VHESAVSVSVGPRVRGPRDPGRTVAIADHARCIHRFHPLRILCALRLLRARRLLLTARGCWPGSCWLVVHGLEPPRSSVRMARWAAHPRARAAAVHALRAVGPDRVRRPDETRASAVAIVPALAQERACSRSRARVRLQAPANHVFLGLRCRVCAAFA